MQSYIIHIQSHENLNRNKIIKRQKSGRSWGFWDQGFEVWVRVTGEFDNTYF
jgi:hypothetical protein